MKFPDTIVLTNFNRDGVKIWLEKKYDNVYSIDASKRYVLEYACCNYDALPDDAETYDFKHEYNGKTIKGNYASFDPAGGPYLAVGSKITEDFILDRVFVDYDHDHVTSFVVSPVKD